MQDYIGPDGSPISEEFQRDFKELGELLRRLAGKVVYTLDVDGAPFHVASHGTISLNTDRRIIVWLDPTEYDDEWRPVTQEAEED